MFSFLSKEAEMSLRLSESDRSEFIEKFEACIMDQHGRVMKKYVQVPSILLKESSAMMQYLEKSLNYVSALKSKPSKKK